jgi:hypothetical protein
MKRNFYRGLLLLVGVPLVFGACNKDDDPAPDPIVGTWKRDVYRLTDVPANFSNFDDFAFDQYYSSAEEGLTITFAKDKTYTRKYDLIANPDVSETGAWTKEGTAVTIKPTDTTKFPEEDFTVVGDITSVAMVLSKSETFTLLPDAVTDTLTTAWANAHPDDLDKYRQNVDVTLQLVFDKVTTP